LPETPAVRYTIAVEPATEEDWSTEYLNYLLLIKVMDGLDGAIDHINRYGSGHTDAIVTADREKAERFMNVVDSADVFWNASSVSATATVTA
jgi:glutamate-5-semialdehyde dehydrogenase